MEHPQGLPREEPSVKDVSVVGGKNASLGELIASFAPIGVRVPPGFATSADPCRPFLRQSGLEAVIAGRFADHRTHEDEKRAVEILMKYSSADVHVHGALTVMVLRC